jgi:hypothetical protein
MDDNLLDSNEVTFSGTRPTFLTVLCILTFIGAGFGILGGLIGLAGTSTMSSGLETIEIPKIYTFIGLISTALGLAGAILMWNLKLKGFFIYVAGAALNVLMSLISIFTLADVILEVTGGDPRKTAILEALLWTTFAFGLIINVAFVWMYAVNKKHLK